MSLKRVRNALSLRGRGKAKRFVEDGRASAAEAFAGFHEEPRQAVDEMMMVLLSISRKRAERCLRYRQEEAENDEEVLIWK